MNLKKLFWREPDFVIGSRDNPYLMRWHLIPRNRFFNIYLHNILRSDDDRALHDHPWWNLSIILRGGYVEHTRAVAKSRHTGDFIFRRATQAHRLELFSELEYRGHVWDAPVWETTPCWSLFITGPKIREWGFLCPQGWRHWRDFIGVPEGDANGDEVGRGCD